MNVTRCLGSKRGSAALSIIGGNLWGSPAHQSLEEIDVSVRQKSVAGSEPASAENQAAPVDVRNVSDGFAIYCEAAGSRGRG
jgi:hypothetical protein